jgi:hypothetical protein
VELEILVELLGSASCWIPSKKTRKINQNLRLLKKEEEFKQIVDGIGTLFLWKSEVREFLYEQQIANILSDAERKAIFFQEFEKLCKKVGV